MSKTKLPRYKIRNLFAALQVCKALDVPSKFRYAIGRNISFIEGEIKATNEAYPEPDLAALKTNTDEASKAPEAEREAAMQLANEKNKKLMEDHEKWVKDIDGHMKEEIETDLYLTDLIEINDTINVPPERRAQQNQAIIEALLPIFKEPA